MRKKLKQSESRKSDFKSIVMNVAFLKKTFILNKDNHDYQ